jgi:hypothetical protein
MYTVEGGDLVVAERESGQVVWRGRPEGYPVKVAFALPGTEDGIVLYRVPGAGMPIPNLVRCRPDGSVVWRAEMPEKRDWNAYSEVRWVGGFLFAWAWNGRNYDYEVLLKPDTGAIWTLKVERWE